MNEYHDLRKMWFALIIFICIFSLGWYIFHLDGPEYGTITTLKTSIHVDRTPNCYPYHVITSEGYWLFPANDSISKCVDAYASSIYNEERILNITVRKSRSRDYIINIDGYIPPQPKPTPVRLP